MFVQTLPSSVCRAGADLTGVAGCVDRADRIDMLNKDDGALVFKLHDPGSLHRIKGAQPQEQVCDRCVC